jgi:2'-5' RNA ligase
MSTIRTFIAIDLPIFIQDKLGEVIQQYKDKQISAVRWVAPRNIHLTLKFLGDISPANLDTLTKVLTAEVNHYHCFEIHIGGSGAFPNTRWPRVIWVGVKAPPSLETLQRGIEGETHRLGYSGEDRPFSPHLTLGRVSNNATPQEIRHLSDALSTMSVGELGHVMVESIRLFRSDLQPGGAVYTPLYTCALSR